MWAPTLLMLATSALWVTTAFCTVTLSYLVYGPYYSTMLKTEITATDAFFALFAFRYLRFLVHLISYFMYKPTPNPEHPKFSADDVTVVLPTIEPSGDVFRKCLETVCLQQPRAFYIAVGRDDLLDPAEECVAGLRLRYPNIDIQCHSSGTPGKRIQIAHVVPRIRTAITILVDDHVFWPRTYLPAILAPFQDPRVGLVGTSKRVTVESRASVWGALWNFLGAVYLERHNFEIAASTTIDGGIFAVSGRTCAIRTARLAEPEFQQRYLNETFGLLGREWGPLGADDDNFITRYMVEKDVGIRVQLSRDATIETPLGEFPKFLKTCLRWARTTFRSNTRSLLLANVWRAQPWSVYGVYIAGLTNFALVFDGLLLRLLARTPWYAAAPRRSVAALAAWILLTKLVKLVPYFARNPRHLVFFPCYVLFAYFHSLLKLWSLLTFWDISWSGRKIVTAVVVVAAWAAGTVFLFI